MTCSSSTYQTISSSQLCCKLNSTKTDTCMVLNVNCLLFENSIWMLILWFWDIILGLNDVVFLGMPTFLHLLIYWIFTCSICLHHTETNSSISRTISGFDAASIQFRIVWISRRLIFSLVLSASLTISPELTWASANYLDILLIEIFSNIYKTRA